MGLRGCNVTFVCLGYSKSKKAMEAIGIFGVLDLRFEQESSRFDS